MCLLFGNLSLEGGVGKQSQKLRKGGGNVLFYLVHVCTGKKKIVTGVASQGSG